MAVTDSIDVNLPDGAISMGHCVIHTYLKQNGEAAWKYQLDGLKAHEIVGYLGMLQTMITYSALDDDDEEE